MQYQGAGPQVNMVLSKGFGEDSEDQVPGILKKMHGIMSDIGAVEKSQKNRAQGFSFRGIDQFQNKLHGLLIKHKVVLVPQVTHRTDEQIESSSGKKQRSVNLVMRYSFMDIEDGSSLSAMMPAEGLDFGDKATNKALSAAFKYCMIQLFSVPTEDQIDGDADSPRLGDEDVPKKASAPKKAARVRKPKAEAKAAEPEAKKPARFKRPSKSKVVEKEDEDDDL